MQRVVDALKDYEKASNNFENLRKLPCEQRNELSYEQYLEIVHKVFEAKKRLRKVHKEVLEEVTVKYTPTVMYRTWTDKEGNEHTLEYLKL